MKSLIVVLAAVIALSTAATGDGQTDSGNTQKKEFCLNKSYLPDIVAKLFPLVPDGPTAFGGTGGPPSRQNLVCAYGSYVPLLVELLNLLGFNFKVDEELLTATATGTGEGQIGIENDGGGEDGNNTELEVDL